MRRHRSRQLFKRQAEDTRNAGLDVGALAPMVDMMTLLLVFLLRSWSTEAAPSPPSGAFELAGTSAEETRSAAVEILVAPDAIYVEGRRVVATAYLGEDALIREVYDPLLGMKGKGRVEVHADRRVPYGVVRKVLSTARSAGYAELSLVAVNKGSL